MPASFDTFLDSDVLPLLVMLLIAAEGGVLLLWQRRAHSGLRPALVLSFLGAGIALMAALYFHRHAEGGAVGFGAAMTAALVLHALHLWQLARR